MLIDILSFFPNYKTDLDTLVMGSSRPTAISGYRDTSLDASFTPEIANKVSSLLAAIGIRFHFVQLLMFG